ncbi:VpsF family polysaccharide biosynthesis protein [Terrarubrum flagellatum]|uniref:VpsF family polysaccharide biosynthesis protein n=1 Tax=Terrirubrum flagellatum TaxID=2895980 RepID=UPI003144F8ED
MTIFSVALLFSVSTMLLNLLGYNYEVAGGSLLEKMHPGDLVAVAAFGLLFFSRRHPFRFATDLLARHLGLTIFLAIWFLLLVYLVIVQKSPFTPIIDTFLLPMIIFALFDQQREAISAPLERFLHAFIAINSLLGVFEVVTGWRLIPYTTAGIEITDDWRATALMGHPLANALMTGCYLLALLLQGGTRLSGAWRFLAIGLTSAGMVAFGGRAAMVLLFLFAAPLIALRTVGSLAYGRATPLQAAMATLGGLFVVGSVGALASAGAFDRFIARFVEDQGSAKSRVAMFDLFESISWRDLLLGPDPALIDTLKQIEGLEFGIESFWVASTLAYGLIMACITFIGIFIFCRQIVQVSRPSAWWLFAYFFAVASTSVSIAAKTCVLAMLAAMMMVLLPPRQGGMRTFVSGRAQ